MPWYKSSRSGWVMVADFRRRQSNSKAVATMAARMASTPCKVSWQVGNKHKRKHHKKFRKIPKHISNTISSNFRGFHVETSKISQVFFWRFNFSTFVLLSCWCFQSIEGEKTSLLAYEHIGQYSVILDGYSKTFSGSMEKCWLGYIMYTLNGDCSI